jgi:hypothetical protein
MGVQHRLYTNDDLVFATKHQKEQVLAPIFTQKLGINGRVCPNIDTDQFGTFSGEIERRFSPLEAARKKNQLAHELTGCQLAVASEGSFGQHPHLFFAPANEELLLFSDFERNLEIVETSLITDTNFTGKRIDNLDQALSFAEKIEFPSHGIIIKKNENERFSLAKGITQPDELNHLIQKHLQEHDSVWLETDMRAHLNPTRMKHIAQLGEKLCDRIHSTCPNCHAPGFGRISQKEGLPCSWCGRPTRSILAQIWGCVRCDHQEEKERPDQKAFEDPQFCDFCNP